jgi:excisionase family DNA binding protein
VLPGDLHNLGEEAASAPCRSEAEKQTKRSEHSPTAYEIKRAVAHLLAMALVADYQRVATDVTPRGTVRNSQDAADPEEPFNGRPGGAGTIARAARHDTDRTAGAATHQNAATPRRKDGKIPPQTEIRAMTSTWLTLAQAADRAQVAAATIRREIKGGRIRAARVGGRRSIRLRPEWVDAWLDAVAQPVEQQYAR